MQTRRDLERRNHLSAARNKGNSFSSPPRVKGFSNNLLDNLSFDGGGSCDVTSSFRAINIVFFLIASLLCVEFYGKEREESRRKLFLMFFSVQNFLKLKLVLLFISYKNFFKSFFVDKSENFLITH